MPAPSVSQLMGGRLAILGIRWTSAPAALTSVLVLAAVTTGGIAPGPAGLTARAGGATAPGGGRPAPASLPAPLSPRTALSKTGLHIAAAGIPTCGSLPALCGQVSGITSASAAAPATLTGALKADVRGLVNDGVMPSSALLNDMAGLVARESWSELQPTAAYNQSLSLIHPNLIDKLVNWVQKYSPVRGLKVKIRVWTGMYSPSWAMGLDGPSFRMNDYACVNVPAPAGCNGGSYSYTFPRWWGPAYGAAYARFQRALGAAYDGNSTVVEVTAPRCMTMWDEPMVRQWDRWSMTNLLGAGYSVGQDVGCQERQLLDMKSAWPHTVISYAVNEYIDVFSSGGSPAFRRDIGTTSTLLRYCRQALGKQCLLQNDEMGRSSSLPGHPDYSQVYSLLAQAGSPLAYMVDSPSRLGGTSLSTVLGQAVAWGANSVEIGRPYTASYAPAFFAPYNSGLARNPWG